MENQKLEVKVALKMQNPLHDVFEAIVDPSKMKNYFIQKGSDRIEEGKTVTWKFPEFDKEFNIRVTKVEKDKYISFFWNSMDDKDMQVEILLIPKEANTTFVTITEKSRPNDETGINWLRGNTEGWANFLACLKAYLEYGINLRKGAFDISQMPEIK